MPPAQEVPAQKSSRRKSRPAAPPPEPAAAAMDVAQFISSVGALLHPHRNGQAAAGAADADSDAVPADDGAAVPDDDGAAPPHALAAEPRRKGRGRKRAEPPEGPQDEPTRAQERLVKNRMSAARSRERKLAYTAELEEQVAALRADNAALREALTKAGVPIPAAADGA